MSTSFMTSPSSLFTSESVTEGHPDKLCDQISDAVLDACLKQDPYSRVACETATKTGFVALLGEITTRANINYDELARRVITEIGYDSSEKGFDGNSCGVLVALAKQSGDIALGVDKSMESKAGEKNDGDIEAIGAGDQGMMFGFACTETPTLMPMPIYLAHNLARRLSELRKTGVLPWLRPDGKTQVTVEYSYGRPRRVHTVLVSTQHAPDISQDEIRQALIEHAILPLVPPEMMDGGPRILVNPTGRFVIGGPLGDSGLTGRKIIVDTYGGWAPHGGGAFSGKDPSKVDRSATYMARHVAKNIVGAKLAREALVQLAYAIGVADPVSVMIDTFGTGVLPDERLTEIVRSVFPLTPRGIIQELDLLRPIYRVTASYGHFGRSEPEFRWESLHHVDALKAEAARLA
jgi:S-adenosylmethionine synthetase